MPPLETRSSSLQIIAIVFSRHRPLQLEATLSSFALHCRDAAGAQLKVLYTSSTPRLQSLYEQVMMEHPGVGFVKQHDFRGDLLGLMERAHYVLFLVDDSLFVREFNLQSAIESLDDQPDALGFSLRLGPNTTN